MLKLVQYVAWLRVADCFCERAIGGYLYTWGHGHNDMDVSLVTVRREKLPHSFDHYHLSYRSANNAAMHLDKSCTLHFDTQVVQHLVKWLLALRRMATKRRTAYHLRLSLLLPLLSNNSHLSHRGLHLSVCHDHHPYHLL